MAKQGKQPGILIATFPPTGYFERAAPKGRGSGVVTRYRYVIKATKYCWEVGLEREGYPNCNPVRYPGRVAHICICLRCVMEEDWEKRGMSIAQVLNAINDSVSSMLKIRMETGLTESSSNEDRNKAALAMDEFYKLDYANAKHEWVKSRLMGISADNEEDDNE